MKINLCVETKFSSQVLLQIAVIEDESLKTFPSKINALDVAQRSKRVFLADVEAWRY